MNSMLYPIRYDAKLRRIVNNNWLITQKTLPINASVVKQQGIASFFINNMLL